MSQTSAPVRRDVSSDLLYVLSAHQEMGWRTFKSAFESLHTLTRAGDAEDASEWGSSFALCRTSATLDALGHACFSFEDRDRVYAAPTALALLPRAGLPEAVLCGARSPKTRAELQTICDEMGVTLRWQDQTQRAANPFVPARASVSAPSLDKLKQIAEKLNIRFATSPPAWDLCQVSRSLDDVLATARADSAATLDWRMKTYNVAALRWEDTPNTAPAKGDLVVYNSARYQQRRHYWAENADDLRPLVPVDPDWGRYATLRFQQKQVLVYDERSLYLAVPSGAPLPRLLARAAALCSGFAPAPLARKAVDWEHPEKREFAVYECVPPQIAQMIGEKLGQRIIQKQFRI